MLLQVLYLIAFAIGLLAVWLVIAYVGSILEKIAHSLSSKSNIRVQPSQKLEGKQNEKEIIKRVKED